MLTAARKSGCVAAVLVGALADANASRLGDPAAGVVEVWGPPVAAVDVAGHEVDQAAVGLPSPPMSWSRLYASALGIERDLYTILQILSVSSFEKVPLFQLLTATPDSTDAMNQRKQLILFDF